MGDIIDISHDPPVYDRSSSETPASATTSPHRLQGGPDRRRRGRLVDLVDRVRADQKRRREAEAPAAADGVAHPAPAYFVGVHCHYGFNRTGYFIVCYLVERCGFSLQAAVDEFAAKRTPKGIRHPHFLGALALRYAHLKDLKGVVSA